MKSTEVGGVEKGLGSQARTSAPRVDADRGGFINHLRGLRERFKRGPRSESKKDSGEPQVVKNDPEGAIGKLVGVLSEKSDYHSPEVKAEVAQIGEKLKKAADDVAQVRYGERAVKISPSGEPKDKKDLDNQRTVSRIVGNSLGVSENPVDGARYVADTPSGGRVYSRVFETDFPGVYTVSYSRENAPNDPGPYGETYVLITKDGLDDRLMREASDGTLIERYSQDARERLSPIEEVA